MAKFLDTTGVSYHLLQLLKNTKDRLILISPYLKVNDRIKQELEELDRQKYDIRLVYRDNQMKPAELNWLRGLPTIRTSVCENLHAKCYLNENEAIVTSMNLYEFSQEHNLEMGIHVTKEQEPDLYSAIYEEAMRLIRGSNEIRITVSQVPKSARTAGAKTTDDHGYCIRCHAEVKLNPMVPYCRDCFKLWKSEKHKTNDGAENYCHICGKPNGSSLNKPSCYDCFKAKKDELEFPLPSNK